jgi:hypothetical protein
MVVVPAKTPDTTPVPETTVATLVVLLLHVPPPASLSEVVEPTQTEGVPLIADGNGLTVTTRVAVQPEGSV